MLHESPDQPEAVSFGQRAFDETSAVIFNLQQTGVGIGDTQAHTDDPASGGKCVLIAVGNCLDQCQAERGHGIQIENDRFDLMEHDHRSHGIVLQYTQIFAEKLDIFAEIYVPPHADAEQMVVDR